MRSFLPALALTLLLAAIAQARVAHSRAAFRQFLRAYENELETALANELPAVADGAPAAADAGKDAPAAGGAPAAAPAPGGAPAARPAAQEAAVDELAGLQSAEGTEAKAHAGMGQRRPKQGKMGGDQAQDANGKGRGRRPGGDMDRMPADADNLAAEKAPAIAAEDGAMEQGPKDAMGGPRGEKPEGRRPMKESGDHDEMGSNSADKDAKEMEEMPRMTVGEFREHIELMVQAAMNGHGLIQETIQAIDDFHVDQDEPSFEKTIVSFVTHSIHNHIVMNKVAMGLVKMMMQLYIGAEGFVETDICPHMAGFSETLDDPKDKAAVGMYVNALAQAIRDDLECFSAQIGRVETEIDTEAMTEGDMTEEHAASVVFGFLQELHHTRLSTIRFEKAVAHALMALEGVDDDTEVDVGPAPIEPGEAPEEAPEEAPKAPEEAPEETPAEPAAEEKVVTRELRNLLVSLLKKRIAMKRIVA